MTLHWEVKTPRSGVQQWALDGRLDATTAPRLGQQMAAQAEHLPRLLILDLDALHYLSSAGMRVIFRARKTQKARGGRLLLSRPQPQIRDVLALVGAIPADEIFASDGELTDYLDILRRGVE